MNTTDKLIKMMKKEVEKASLEMTRDTRFSNIFTLRIQRESSFENLLEYDINYGENSVKINDERYFYEDGDLNDFFEEFKEDLNEVK